MQVRILPCQPTIVVAEVRIPKCRTGCTLRGTEGYQETGRPRVKLCIRNQYFGGRTHGGSSALEAGHQEGSIPSPPTNMPQLVHDTGCGAGANQMTMPRHRSPLHGPLV